MAVKLRLIEDPTEIEEVLARLEHSPDTTVVDTTGPRPARYDTGVQVNATVTVGGTLYPAQAPGRRWGDSAPAGLTLRAQQRPTRQEA